MHVASLASAFDFRDTFWQISSICLLNFNLQSKFMSSNFSLRELFKCKLSIVRTLEVLDYLKVDDLYQYSASFDYSKTGLQSFLLFSLELLPYLLSLTTKGVFSSSSPVKYVAFNIRKMSHVNMLNKSGPSIEP